MTDWTRVKTIFEDALSVPDGERAEWVARTCSGDASLRDEVLSLLEADLDASRVTAAVAPEAATDSQAEGRFGAYRLVREIGRGGMGTVYLAQRVGEFEQRVALKIVRRSLADADVERRFRTERQVLASLAHPNIARLLDGGVGEAGEPYFAMEYVEGEPLPDYAERHRLGVRARVELFRQVCSAVSYAHTCLVVHRDIKPSNILVTADGVPKLIDFGLAKVVDTTLSGDLQATLSGFRAFTPAYASPEQVHGGQIGTASDVYSLGVVLYELLSGHRPFEFGGSTLADILRTLDTRDPQRPSAAIAGDAVGLPYKASALEGDLDTIVLMALRREPERRYRSVELLADDLQRYLDGKPVLAHPGTAVYRGRKFLRRHAVASAATALAIGAVVSGLGVSVWQARIARQERDRATRRFEDVRRLSNSLLFELSPRIERLNGATSARDLLVRRALEYLDSLAREAGDDVALQNELAAAYEKIGDLHGNPTNPNLIEFGAAIDSYLKARRIRERTFTLASGDRPAQLALAENRRVLGNIYSQANEFDRAAHDLAEALRIIETVARAAPGDTSVRMARARVLHDLGRHQSNSSRYADALAPLARSIDEAERLRQARPGDVDLLSLLADTHAQLGLALSWEGRQPDAETHMREAAAMYEPLLAAHPGDVALRDGLWSVYWLTSSVYEEQDDRQAHAFAERALALIRPVVSQDPDNVRAQQQLAKSYSRLGQTATNLGHADEAIGYLRDASRILGTIASGESRNGRLRSEQALALARLADARAAQGHLDNALVNARQAAAIYAEVTTRFSNDRRSVRNLVLAYQSLGAIHDRLASTGPAGESAVHRRAAVENYRKALDTLEGLKSQAVLASSDGKLLDDLRARLAAADVKAAGSMP